ncbi:YIP1 family protein [Albidovulum sp.]
MAVTDDIVATYRGPARVMRRLLAGGDREGRALAYLLAALIVLYIAQWPALSRAGVLDETIPLGQRMFAAFLGVLALLPAFYLIAALSRLLCRVFGGRGSWSGSRIVLFWALLAVTPVMLLRGLVAGFLGPGPALIAANIAAFAVFGWFWLSGLAVAEFPEAGDGA